MSQMHASFGDVASFLKDDDMDIPPVTRQKLLAVLNDVPQCRKLKMELTMTIDGMEPFVKATYSLEGDGLLAFIAYERISILYSHVASNHHPNVTAVAKQLANGNSTNEQILITYGENSVQSAYE